MHYCIAIITEEFPTDDVLRSKLAPYNEEMFYSQFESEDDEKIYPQFLWDYWIIGGRYGGTLKLKIDEENEEYDWDYFSKVPRSGRLYRSRLLEVWLDPNSRYSSHTLLPREEEVYGYLGSDNGYIRVDGCKVKDCLNFEDTVLNTWGFIGKDDAAYSRSYWNGKDIIPDEHYEEKVKAAIADVDDCYVCIVDIHD